MKESVKSEKGAIILEASIVLPIFIIVILCVYQLFSLSIANNQITHALMQASKSLSMDPYVSDRITSAADPEGTGVTWGSLVDKYFDVTRGSNSKYFSSSSKWYEQTSGIVAPGDSNGFQSIYDRNKVTGRKVIKERFIGYFSGGDESAADERLHQFGVIDGLSGILIMAKTDGKDMTITASYNMRLMGDAFGIGVIPFRQEITVRLWNQK